MDIQGGADEGNNIITYPRHDGTNQQWHIDNNSRCIISAGGNLALDISEGKCYPGADIIAYGHHGAQNQQFHIQYC